MSTKGSPREPFLRRGRPRKGEQAFLASVGISKKLSMQCQLFASLPPEIREDVAKRRLSFTEALNIARLAKRIVREGLQNLDDLE